jgi:hypothetical protein
MIVGGVIALVVIIGVLFYAQKFSGGVSKYEGFAQCLKDSGAKFFGAFWCPHCQAQKALFGSAKRNLPYIECSTPDGKGQLAVCKDNGVTSYPTWVFPDLSTTTGEVALSVLAEKTSCKLPE